MLQMHSIVLQEQGVGGGGKTGSLVHANQHLLGNSDLNTSSELERSHVV